MLVLDADNLCALVNSLREAAKVAEHLVKAPNMSYVFRVLLSYGHKIRGQKFQFLFFPRPADFTRSTGVMTDACK